MNGIDVIKYFERCELQAYPDPATNGEPWTIGWGSTVGLDGKPVSKGMRITEEVAQTLLNRDVERIRKQIDSDDNLKKLSSGCKDAIMSLCYNIKGGYSSFKKSKCYAGITEGDVEKVFHNWDWGVSQKGVALGLARRRAKELDLFLTSWK